MGERGPKPDGLKVVWFRIAPETLAEIEHIAEAQRLTVSAVLRILVNEALAARKGGRE